MSRRCSRCAGNSSTAMPIERGKVVTLSYELRDGDGHSVHEEGAQVAYLHGYGGIFPKVEAARAARDAGDEVSITLEPDDASGDYDTEPLRGQPSERFPRT